MHDLSRKIEIAEAMVGRSLRSDEKDKIITSWLEEKIRDWNWEMGITKEEAIKRHFGLSKTSCKCGACVLHECGEFWYCKRNRRQDCRIDPGEFCPSCGEKLEVNP